MKKDYLTEKELEELEALKELDDVYQTAVDFRFEEIRDLDDYGMTGADQGFMLGYSNA
jgi:hypothetical protein